MERDPLSESVMIGQEASFRLDIMKKFFTQMVVRHWYKLSREVMDAPFLEMLLKVKLDGVLSNLLYWKVSLPTEKELQIEDL